jgi:hypothetical protein
MDNLTAAIWEPQASQQMVIAGIKDNQEEMKAGLEEMKATVTTAKKRRRP